MSDGVGMGGAWICRWGRGDHGAPIDPTGSGSSAEGTRSGD